MGRPRGFDEPALLDVAQELFWTRGFDRTSIDEIAQASGVGNGSIYAAYRSKLGLFTAVFERYCAQRVELVDQAVAERHGSFEQAVEHYLAEIVADCTGHADRRGCLMLNSIAELGARYPEIVAIGSRSTARMERVLASRISRAVEDGQADLAPAEVDALAAHILLVSQGLIQLSRFGSPVEHLRSIATASSRMSALLAAA